MKIVTDNKIPYIQEVIDSITSDTVYINGSDIKADDVRDADALIVRTRTRCDRRLLEGSNVKFVATATIGYDHIDTEYMRRAGIKWMNCPGCNSGSVAQYIRSVLILLRREGLIPDGGTLGIVGCGHVGDKVKKAALDMGLHIMTCDPPRRNNGEPGFDATLNDIAKMCDAITFHVPLTKSGKYPTWHLADYDFFGNLQRCPVIINTSRGAVVDNRALSEAMENGKVRQAVIDTWENEPDIDRALLSKVYIGTPHIAGYSADGKANADNMVIDGLCRFFGIKNKWHVEPPEMVLGTNVPERGTDDYHLYIYNPLEDSRRLKEHPEQFEHLRGNYPLRREL